MKGNANTANNISPIEYNSIKIKKAATSVIPSTHNTGSLINKDKQSKDNSLSNNQILILNENNYPHSEASKYIQNSEPSSFIQFISPSKRSIKRVKFRSKVKIFKGKRLQDISSIEAPIETNKQTSIMTSYKSNCCFPFFSKFK